MRLSDLYYFRGGDLAPRHWVVCRNVAYHHDQPLAIRYSDILDKYFMLIDINGCAIRIKIPWWLTNKCRKLFERIFEESPRHHYGLFLNIKDECKTAKKVKKVLHTEKVFLHYYAKLISEERYAAWLKLSNLNSSRKTFCQFIRESIADVKDVNLDEDRCIIVFNENSEVCSIVGDGCWFKGLSEISITLPHFVRSK